MYRGELEGAWDSHRQCVFQAVCHFTFLFVTLAASMGSCILTLPCLGYVEKGQGRRWPFP